MNTLNDLEILLEKDIFKISKTKKQIKTKDNFFKNTFAIFQKVNDTEILNNKPDFISYSKGHFYNDGGELGVHGKGEISSQYYYTDKGVYRQSKHWGQCASCYWGISETNSFDNLEQNINNSNLKNYGEFDEFILGFCSWNDFFEIKEKNASEINEKEYFLANDFKSVFFDKIGKRNTTEWDWINKKNIDVIEYYAYKSSPNHSGDTVYHIDGLNIEKLTN